jgi:uncharacterized protein YeaO (DUF488 family)
MKQLFTSNYARSSSYDLSFSISKKAPDWYKGKQLPQYAPTWEMIVAYKDNALTSDEYALQYISLLKSRHQSPQKIVDALPDKSRLLCYESPGDFCHRRVLAQWVEDELGLIIPEYVSEVDIAKNQALNELFTF